MAFNKLIRLAEHSDSGRYIGAGRDKSGPTGVRMNSSKCIIGSLRLLGMPQTRPSWQVVTVLAEHQPVRLSEIQ
jgi:hypothetical protein